MKMTLGTLGSSWRKKTCNSPKTLHRLHFHHCSLAGVYFFSLFWYNAKVWARELPIDFARLRAVVKSMMPSPFQSTSSLPCRPVLTFFGVRAKRSNLTWALNLLEAHTIQRIKSLAHWTYLRESPSFDMIPPLSALLKMEKSCTEHGAHWHLWFMAVDRGTGFHTATYCHIWGLAFCRRSTWSLQLHYRQEASGVWTRFLFSHESRLCSWVDSEFD